MLVNFLKERQHSIHRHATVSQIKINKSFVTKFAKIVVSSVRIGDPYSMYSNKDGSLNNPSSLISLVNRNAQHYCVSVQKNKCKNENEC